MDAGVVLGDDLRTERCREELSMPPPHETKRRQGRLYAETWNPQKGGEGGTGFTHRQLRNLSTD